MHEHDPARRADGTLKPLAEQAPRESAPKAKPMGVTGGLTPGAAHVHSGVASTLDSLAGASATAAEASSNKALPSPALAQGAFATASAATSASLIAAANAAYQDGPVIRPPGPEPMHRFAVYLAPAPDSAWWKAGSSWLGRDAATGEVLSQPLIPGVSMSMQQRLTAAPRRYGWHATLKAPFALADDADAVMLQGRLSGLARDRRPFVLPLRVALLGDFLALIPDGDTRDIDALARHCVSHLHALAAPLSPSELARRRASGLSPDEDKMLQRWGYPYVMEHFRLHFSLTGSLRDVDAETIDALQHAAEQWFAPLPPLRVDAVSVFAEPVAGADFLFIDRMELGA